MRSFLAIAALAIATPALAAQVDDRAALAIAKPQALIVAKDVPAATLAAILKPVDAFYGFRNNGSPTLLKAALTPGFVDHTLLNGRPQGPTGPAVASKAFLGAVPDLRIAVVQRPVVGDRLVSHLHFTGHFTGTFMGAVGTGQPIDFIATDILRMSGGKITDNWHIEDNLTFQQQIEVVSTS